MKHYTLFMAALYNTLFGLGLAGGLFNDIQTLAVGFVLGEAMFVWAILKAVRTFGPYVQNLPARDKMAAENYETLKAIAEQQLMIHARQELMMAAMDVEKQRRLAQGDTHKEVA